MKYNKLYSDNEIKINIMRSVQYKSMIIREVAKCLLCDKSMIDLENKEQNWNSILAISTTTFRRIPDIEFFTICPKCRNKKINDIYQALIKRGING